MEPKATFLPTGEPCPTLPTKQLRIQAHPMEPGSALTHHLRPGGRESSSCNRRLPVHGTQGPGPAEGACRLSHGKVARLVLNDFRGLLFQKKNVSNLTDFCEPRNNLTDFCEPPKYHVFLT